MTWTDDAAVHGEAAVRAVEERRDRAAAAARHEPLWTYCDRLSDPRDLTEVEALQEVVRDALRDEGVFPAAAVVVENLRPSTRREGDTEGTWTAMNGTCDVLSGTVVIDWVDDDHRSGSVTVLVGSAGCW